MWALVTYSTVLPISKKIDWLLTKYLVRGLLAGAVGLLVGRKVERRKKKPSMDSQTFDTPATIDTPMMGSSTNERI